MKKFYVYLGIVSGFITSVYGALFFASRVNAAADPAVVNASQDLVDAAIANTKGAIFDLNTIAVLALMAAIPLALMMLTLIIRRQIK